MFFALYRPRDTITASTFIAFSCNSLLSSQLELLVSLRPNLSSQSRVITSSNVVVFVDEYPSSVMMCFSESKREKWKEPQP